MRVDYGAKDVGWRPDSLQMEQRKTWVGR